MNADNRFRCPTCGFTVFNCRVATCESCAAVLPSELRFTSEDLKLIEADHERNTKIRLQLAHKAAERDASLAKRRRFYGTLGGSL